MRLSICHETDYRYDEAPNSVIELLRLTPASTANQTVRSWRIDVSGDAALRRSEDAFGNLVHTFSVLSPGENLTITATGTVDTEPTNGVVTGTPERLPVGVYLRNTPLTEPDDAIRDLAAAARAKSGGAPLDRAHAINTMVFESMTYETGRTTAATTASAALESGLGVCQDLTHILIAAARVDGLPARYVSGYQYVEGRPRAMHESHAWAEIHLPDLGWVSFDPTVGMCGTDHYVRLAVGLDTMSASPLRGAIYGGLGEVLDVTVTVDCVFGPSGRQRQTQSGPGGSQSQSMD
ncbi:transglutaminase family protein [Acuticoccus sp. I52.16.1]|uniref:transglutaminase family protein n=1 Tax=Acuticoccus sp. I52.16.1 TaxID=2928472 RepID=UPI001FD1EB68|nr:transglutaminase family protein [Acuticoccus sp. I52.16.1]UOM33971.1 transglutaminase family protein [Acuticoccus sp. I52.16.1]